MEDRSLTRAIVAYLGRGQSASPLTDDAAVAALAGGEDSTKLQERARDITDEMRSIEIDWETRTLSEGGREAQRILAARHPELGQDALEALYWMFTYNWR